MENEMMNNMDAMTENLTDAMPEVDNLVPSVDENHAEMSSASGSFGKTAVFMLAGAAAYKGAELLCKHVLVPLCYKAKNWIDSKKAKDEPIEAETLYANNEPIEYVVKSQSVDIWRHEAPVITPKRQNLVKDVLFKIVGALNSIIDFIVMVLED